MPTENKNNNKTKAKYTFTFEHPIKYTRELTFFFKEEITTEVKRLVITKSKFCHNYYVELYKEKSECENALCSDYFLTSEKDLEVVFEKIGI